jgi:hypothetical protein
MRLAVVIKQLKINKLQLEGIESLLLINKYPKKIKKT